MFNISVKVPRITSAQVAELEKTMPGFSAVADIPVIETVEQAVSAARVIGDKQMASREFISSRDTEVTETDTGWKIKFLCFGD